MPFDTPLTPQEEKSFQQWFAKNKQAGNIHPQDMGQDYDMRGAFKAGLQPGPDKHWPDTYKKPNHPTFSDESIYSSLTGTKPGSWQGEKFIPFGAGKPATQSGIGYSEQPNTFWKALEGVVNGLRGFQGAKANPSLFHEPTMTAASSVGPAMQGSLDVMADPRNAWMGMGPVAGMAMMGKGIRSAGKGIQEIGGFNVPVSEMRRALDMPRPNVRMGEVPGGAEQGVRQEYMGTVGGMNTMAEALTDPRHPKHGMFKELFDNLGSQARQEVMGTIRGNEALQMERMKAMQEYNNLGGHNGKSPIGYGQ